MEQKKTGTELSLLAFIIPFDFFLDEEGCLTNCCCYFFLLSFTGRNPLCNTFRHRLMNGSSWANAFAGISLQAVINASASGDEAWVATGSYFTTNTANRSIYFNMLNSVAIYGNFINDKPAVLYLLVSRKLGITVKIQKAFE
jgi:hypothetical protein